MAVSRWKTVALPAIVDLDALDETRDKLLDAVEAGPVSVSGRAVQRVSTNALIMLIGAAETAQRNNFAFEIKDTSGPMLSAIDRLGFDERFAGLLKG